MARNHVFYPGRDGADMKTGVIFADHDAHNKTHKTFPAVKGTTMTLPHR